MKISSYLIQNCLKVNPSRVNRRFLHEKIWSKEDTLVPNEANIKAQLTQYSVPFTDGYTCLHLKECACSQKLPKTGDLFVNKRTGFFLCQHCKGTGEWSTYSNLLSQAKTEPVNLEETKRNWQRYDKDFNDWKEIQGATEALKNLTDAHSRVVFENFNLPNCSKSVSDRLKIRINKEKSQLFFPLHCPPSSVVGYKTLDQNGEESTFPRAECPGFLLYSTYSRTAAVIVANIKDFLALISQNLPNYDIICLQYGTTHLPQTTLPFLEKYSRIVLWLGEASLDSTGLFARKLVEKRCYVVRPTKNQISASTALSTNQNINEIVSKAKLAWHQYVTTFSSFREDVLAELQDRNRAEGVPWQRFPALTKLLKGHRRGELTVLTGSTGVGKTTFLSEYSLDLAKQGVNTLWGSFEIKNTRLAKILLTQFAEGPLSKDVDEYNVICDKFEELPIYFLTFHGQQDLNNVMDAVKHCSYTYDIAHVIIDNVQFMIEVAPEYTQLDRFWRQDYMIQSFRHFASNFNCHVTLVMHPRKIEGVDLNVNSIFGGVKASQEADNVLIIQKKDLNTFGVKKYLQVSKNRFSGDLGLFPLYFDKASLCFSRPVNVNKAPIKPPSFEQPESWNENEESEEKEVFES